MPITYPVQRDSILCYADVVGEVFVALTFEPLSPI